MKVGSQVSHQQWADNLNTLRLKVAALARYQPEIFNFEATGMGDACQALTGEEEGGAISPECLPQQTPARVRMYDALCEKVAAARQQVLSHPIYSRLLRAYNHNHQLVIATLLPRVFGNRHDESLIHGGLLFHGVDFDPQEMSIGCYIDHVMKIQGEGLKPTPFGDHHSMDESIRPAYCVTEECWTHGLLFLGFEPGMWGYAAFSDGWIDQERMIYAPIVDVSLKLYLKTSSHLAGCDIWGDHCAVSKVTNKELSQYRDQLEKRLRERGIPFELHEELRPPEERVG